MLVANKLVMHYIPAPSLVSLIQLLACTGIILLGKMLGVLQLDAVETHQLRWLLLYSGEFQLFSTKLTREFRIVVSLNFTHAYFLHLLK